LRRRGALGIGSHEIAVDGETLRFRILAASPDTQVPHGSGSLGWDDVGRLTADPNAISICGAELPVTDRPEPAMARRGNDQTWLIHRNGSWEPVTEPAVPETLAERVPDLQPYYFEFEPARTASWLMQLRGGHWNTTGLRAAGPEFTPFDERSRALWAQVEPHGPTDDPLWNLYLQRWEQASAR